MLAILLFLNTYNNRKLLFANLLQRKNAAISERLQHFFTYTYAWINTSIRHGKHGVRKNSPYNYIKKTLLGERYFTK